MIGCLAFSAVENADQLHAGVGAAAGDLIILLAAGLADTIHLRIDIIIAVGIHEAHIRIHEIFQQLVALEPVALEELYIPYSVVPGLEEVDIKLFSIYDIYQWNGIVLGEGHQTLRITRLPPMLAKHMDVPPEQAVMELSCTTRDRGGRVVEFSRCYVRNDKAEFVVHFRHTNP